MERVEIKQIADYIKELEEGLDVWDYQGQTAQVQRNKLYQIIKRLMNATFKSMTRNSSYFWQRWNIKLVSENNVLKIGWLLKTKKGDINMSQEPVKPGEKSAESKQQTKSEEQQQSEPKEDSSTQPDQPKDLISIVSKLKDCTFILAGVVLLFYVTGFIIVSIYLLSKGVAELELAKARYINVGVMFWTITLIGMVSGSIFIP